MCPTSLQSDSQEEQFFRFREFSIVMTNFVSLFRIMFFSEISGRPMMYFNRLPYHNPAFNLQKFGGNSHWVGGL
uniref:Uncharacterized protein n=1 Tax=Caenorhabditis japonica TaxID=281687 RepID=A0A8R1ELH8_CAEJA